MLQITEDTPPDMLAGAMDLTVHLPTGRSVKMSVERSTPMMDLLVQITTNQHLQLSGYTLQALSMAPSSDHTDRMLPFKPNTPIGALDTQHVKVIPKSRMVPVPKNIPPGHQPFESTFRLRVHLPRNQLFVTRVSQSVYLEDIMKKVCEEKNLDPVKYEFRHPGNLDQVLDPKLTLSDYQITEIHLVSKGTGSLNQAFSSSDIMALRKEEERKQMHNKTGGGVFNLIFRRGKSSTTGSLSSENRSISPTQSDDSRSVTPPGIQQPIITPPQPDQVAERPKPPQRKRRPAPKPPQVEESRRNSTEKPPSNISDLQSKKIDASGLTICHSRNSSDSSGYHEASILSDNCNTSLPRRPKSTIIPEDNKLSESTSNLAKMSGHSKSTSSLAFPSRKKKSAPPPPPVLKSASSVTNLESPSPVVASQPPLTAQPSDGKGQDLTASTSNPAPKPRIRTKVVPTPRPRSSASLHIAEVTESQTDPEKTEAINMEIKVTEAANPLVLERINEIADGPPDIAETTKLVEEVKVNELPTLQKQNVDDILKSDSFATNDDKVKPPEVVALHPKPLEEQPKSIFDSYSRKRGFQIGASLLASEDEGISSSASSPKKTNSLDLSTTPSVASALNSFNFGDEIEGVNMELFKESSLKEPENKTFHQLHGMHELENLPKNNSISSLRSVNSLPGFLSNTNMKKWNNLEELDDISLHSANGRNVWVIGDTSDTESTISTTRTPLDSLVSMQSPSVEEEPEVVPQKVEEVVQEKIPEEIEKHPEENELDWQYQLPSPPKAFRDTSPVPSTNEEVVDSVVTSPELFEKLKVIVSETVSDKTSVVSEEDKPILSQLSLENLEKRKSLVYNRELSTSLKLTAADNEKTETFSNCLTKFEKTYDEIKRSSPKEVVAPKSTLPNFKITTYDNPKQKLNIFEDDTIRSNSEASKRHNSFIRRSSEETNLKRNSIGRSMESISSRKGSLTNPETNDYKFYRPQTNVSRSESFSTDQEWSPTKPVTRSKSQVALNRYKDRKNSGTSEDESLSKSTSSFDVSGLQSLGVMRLIQNKLNTPTNSSDDLDKTEKPQPQVQRPVENKQPVKTYRVPSINMGTWSERPKIPVNVKEDPDYKFSVKDTNNSKLIVNTTNNDIKSTNTVEVKRFATPFRIPEDHNRNVSIKVNGSESISAQTSGNVIIKIGDPNKTNFRKPLGTVNKIETGNPRPHSIAFGSDFDISRVPIVRSVEFKKPFKDFQDNTSVTQIYQTNNFKSNTLNRNGFGAREPISNGTEKYQSTESMTKPQTEPKPVFRVNSYLQSTAAPVVRGFQTNRTTWSQPHSFSTLQPPKREFTTNKSVPFSQSNLRRTESTKTELVNPPVPPPAPVINFKNINHHHKPVENNNCGGDPKEQLLQAIRDFGGKKGLRAVRA